MREWEEIQEVPRCFLTSTHARPRERLEALGPEALTDVELLAVLVAGGGQTRPAGQTASAILERAGHSLSELARVPARALRRIDGVGPAAASRLAAAIEIGRRARQEAWAPKPRIRGARDVFRLTEARLCDLVHEEFHVLLLDAQHALLRDVTVTRGILDAALVHPREVFRPAIEHSAAAVILVHNHPSGDPTPSAEDRAVTAQVRSAGLAIGIEVLDHVVVARGGFASAESTLPTQPTRG